MPAYKLPHVKHRFATLCNSINYSAEPVTGWERDIGNLKWDCYTRHNTVAVVSWGSMLSVIYSGVWKSF